MYLLHLTRILMSTSSNIISLVFVLGNKTKQIDFRQLKKIVSTLFILYTIRNVGKV